MIRDAVPADLAFLMRADLEGAIWDDVTRTSLVERVGPVGASADRLG